MLSLRKAGDPTCSMNTAGAAAGTVSAPRFQLSPSIPGNMGQPLEHGVSMAAAEYEDGDEEDYVEVSQSVAKSESSEMEHGPARRSHAVSMV